MKKWLFVLIFSALIVFSSWTLNVFVDANRFLDENNNTILEINYQVPYKELKFMQTENGFESILEVEFYLLKNDKIVYDYIFPNGIIVSNKQKTVSNCSFSDKMIITLTKPFIVNVVFNDKNSEESSNWNYKFDVLTPLSLISDIEFSSEVLPDTTIYLEKFHRNGNLFKVIPSHVITKYEATDLIAFFELYNPFQTEKKVTLYQTISRKDSLISKKEKEIILSSHKTEQIHTIPIAELKDGLYNFNLEVIMDSLFDFKQDYFSINTPKFSSERMFVELEDEFKLISYFLTSEQTRSWESLSREGKLSFISRFWSSNDPDIMTEKNEFYELVKERVQHANQEFSHFNKGWDSDRGRIYIRHGKPDEIISGNTGLNTKYTQKEYKIWKYRSKGSKTYIFIDLQMSSNYRIIYAENDDFESSNPNWESYLGTDFDPTVLE